MRNRAINEIPRPHDATDAPPREARFPSLVGLKCDLQRRLDELNVAVIGAGGTGLIVCTQLAQLSPRSITIVDPNAFKQENLLTQRITAEAIGINKAVYAGRLCKRISPRTLVRAYEGRAEELPVDALSSMDVILLATDNLTVEVDVAQRCIHAGVPLIQASVAGEMLVAQIRFCANRDGSGPCLACSFGPLEWTHVNSETVFSCENAYHEGAGPRPANRADTRSVGFLCSLAADLAMMQLLRYLGGLGQPVEDTILEYCAFTHHTCISPLTRNAACRCEHLRWDRCRLARPVKSYTPRELAQVVLGCTNTLAGISMAIDGTPFCDFGICTGCGARQPIARFVHSLRGSGRCVTCNGSVDGQPFCTHQPVPLTVLGDCLDRPLAEIVDKPPESVVVRGPGRAALCKYFDAPLTTCN